MNDQAQLIIANMVAQKAQQSPDLDVITFEHQGQLESVTYKSLWEDGQRLAVGMQSIGLAKGDYIALLLQNHSEFVKLMVASSILGTILVPIDPRMKGAKLSYMLNDSGCKAIVCADYSATAVNDVLGQCEVIEHVLCIGSTPLNFPVATASLSEFLNASLPSPYLTVAVEQATEPMELMYTSGTTGDPKGILVPYARFGGAAGHGEAVFGYKEGDRPYTGLSLTHGNAQFVTLAASIKMGLRCVISRKFTKSRLWDIIRENGCTTFSLLGGMATAIYSEPVQDNDAHNPIRMVVSAGMPAALWEKFESRFALNIFEFYGAMEGGMSFKPIGEGPVGSCGRVAPGLIAKLVDDEGNEVPRGSAGEIIFRLENGPHPAVKYLNNAKASAAKVVDGWLLSGDVMIMDEEGWLFYQYRKGGGIRRNGEFINPAQVERLLAEHSSIDDVFVYGVSRGANEGVGEKDVVAAVKPAADFDSCEVFSWLEKKLPANMVPSFIQCVDEIPKTASEKPQERFLLEEFQEKPDRVFKH